MSQSTAQTTAESTAHEGEATENPIATGIDKLNHELSVLGLSTEEGDTFTIAESYNPATFQLTNYTFWLIGAVLLCILFFVAAANAAKKSRAKGDYVPKGVQNLGEMAVSFVRDSLIVEVMGPEGVKYLPFVGTVFFFILFNNLFGNIPPILPGTGTISTTAFWGVTVFIVYNAIGIKKNGLGGYLKSLVPSGTPKAMAPLIFLLELVSHILRPITLAVRLFANMFAGHIILGVFTLFCAIALEHFTASSAIVLPASFLMEVVMRGFELFVAVLQAYIFTILTAVYINGALHASEH